MLTVIKSCIGVILIIIVVTQSVLANPPCGTTIGGMNVLDDDLNCPGGVGLVLSDNAVIRLNGYSISCTDCMNLPRLAEVGILISGSGVKILGPGRINGFSYGIRDDDETLDGQGRNGVEIKNLLLTENTREGLLVGPESENYSITGVIAAKNDGNGIFVSGTSHRLFNVESSGNNNRGLVVCGEPCCNPGLPIPGEGNHTLRNIRVIGNGTAGLEFCINSGGSRLDQATLVGNRKADICIENGGNFACFDLNDSSLLPINAGMISCETSGGGGDLSLLCPTFTK